MTDNNNDNPLLSYRSTIYMPDMDCAFRVYQTHWRVTKSYWSRPLHDHPIFELNIVLDGVQDVLIGDTEYEMQAGDVLLIQPGVPHRVVGTRGNDVTYFAIHFDVEDYMFRSLLSLYRCGLHRRDSETELEIRKPLHDLIELLKAYRTRDLSQPALRMKLMSHVFALFAALGSVQQSDAPPKDVNQVVYRMAEHIDNISKAGFDDAATATLDTGIAHLAEKLGYSRSYLCRVFRKVFGVSPRKYLSNSTLHHARLELLNPNQSMEQIAEKLGFQDGAHFSKQFKRWTGASPTEYRHIQQNQFHSG